MNAQQLEDQSERDREDIQNTIGEIKRRLTPGQLIDELLAYTKDGGAQFLSNLGRQASENPLPVTLIGSGLAWFLMSKGGAGSSNTVRSDGISASGDKRPENGGSLDSASLTDRLSQSGERAVEAVSGSVTSATQVVEDAAETLSSSVADKTTAITDAAKNMYGSASTMTANSLDFVKGEPFVLLGLGLAVGAAMGAALPNTEAENKVMGGTSAEVKDKLKDVAGDQLESAQAAGEQVYHDVVKSIKTQATSLASPDTSNNPNSG